MIEAEAVSVALSGREVVRGVTLTLRPGELTIIVGPNGAGKTTLLRALVGDIPASTGKIRFHGIAIGKWSGRDLARRRAVLSQSQHLAFPFTVHEVVALGLRAGEGGRSGVDPVGEALGRVDLAGYQGRYFQQLSGGEQQRVHLARVLSQLGPPVRDGGANWLFLDEPTASLDIRHQFQILDLARMHARGGGGAVAILHDINLATDYADRLVVIARGEVAGDGPPDAVLTEGLIENVFGVAAHRVLRRVAAPG